MFKKIASIFNKKDRKHRKLNLEKDAIDEKNKQIFDEYFHRLPGFPQGIPVIPVELLFQKNDELIKQIVLARGMSGPHNKAEVETKIMSPIRHLAEMTHLLLASEKNHFKLPGGLFSFCLEVSLFSLRYTERRILTRATPEIRREEESLWAHAAFLTGLFCEAITAISKLSVYAEDVGIEWHPGMESLYEWLQRNNLKRYHIRWSENEDRSMIYALAGKAINTEQAGILVRGEKAILKTLLGALNDQTDHSNPLAKINDTVRYKIMERDEWSYADRYGKPLAGMHLEPWLIDAMRHLVQKKRWNPNEDNGRLWHGKDGVFLAWPLAANDMQFQLKASECPFLPSTQEILADIMLDAGIIEKNQLGGYLFDIGVPVAESDEKKHVEALKLARYEILFVKNQHKPIDGNLRIEVEEDDDFVEDDSKNKNGTDKPQSKLDGNGSDQEIVSSNSEEDEDDQNSNSDANKTIESITQSPETNAETIDINILFGKPAEPVVKEKAVPIPPCEEDPELEALFSGESVSSATNQYDDDYAADYDRGGEIGYQEFPSSNKCITNDVLKDRPLEEKNNLISKILQQTEAKCLSEAR
jgi:conjugal transfer pilus assembly protein TraI